MIDLLSRVEMYIRTGWLHADPRVLKECQSLSKLVVRVLVSATEGRTCLESGVLFGGVRYHTFPLVSRRLGRAGRFGWLKLLEFTVRVLARVLRARSGVVWVHDLDVLLVPALAGPRLRRRGIRLVWDQHEYPSNVMVSSRLFRACFRRSCGACSFVLHANAPRRDAVLRLLDGSLQCEHLVLENLPNQSFADAAPGALPAPLESWLANRPFFLVVGGLSP